MSKQVAKRPSEIPIVEPITEPVECAKEAGLCYVSDQRPGIRRVRSGNGFRYVDDERGPVRDPDVLARIRSLVIPPAWTKVWICRSPNGHLQATGYDARGRKQYRYHPRWRCVRDETKYDKMILFGQALPRIRGRVRRHLALPGLPRLKVLATIVRLLEESLIRVGNEEYARENHSFGLTTMRNRHAEVSGAEVRFEFRGKSGVKHCVAVHDRRLARIVHRCQEIPGDELFQYIDDEGARHAIDSADVNAYLREISGRDFTAKDFRTWAGTVLAARALLEGGAFKSQTEAKRNIVKAIESVAERLGNTKAVCRKCYVHPGILESYLAGSLVKALQQRGQHAAAASVKRLPHEEAAVLVFLQERLVQANGAPLRRRSKAS